MNRQVDSEMKIGWMNRQGFITRIGPYTIVEETD